MVYLFSYHLSISMLMFVRSARPHEFVSIRPLMAMGIIFGLGLMFLPDNWIDWIALNNRRGGKVEKVSESLRALYRYLGFAVFVICVVVGTTAIFKGW
jgi:hypothetical protein